MRSSDLFPRGTKRLMASVLLINLAIAAAVIAMIAFAVKWVIS